MSGPALSVVISTLGMHDVLARVLDGYEHQSAGPGAFEVIVAADAAEPDPAAVERLLEGRPYEARMVRGGRPGLSANRNAGWQEARAELVLFTDNDTIPAPGLIAEHLDWHGRNPGREVSVLGHVRWAPELRVTPFMKWLDRGIQFDFPFIDGIEAGWGRYYGANVSSKRSLLELAGGFDEVNLPYGYEDLEFARRAADHGLRVLYNRDAIVDHLREMTLGFWQQRARRVAAAERRFVSLHPDVEPYFHRIFSHVAGLPPARGLGRHLIGFVGPDVPWLGPRAWNSADLYYKQALAPHFLDAWDEATGEPGALTPDLRERGG